MAQRARQARVAERPTRSDATAEAVRPRLFDRDPLFRLLDPYLSANWRRLWLVLCAYLVVTVGALVAVAALNGTLTSPSLERDFNIDVHRFPAFSWFAGTDLPKDSTSSTAIPLLRDYSLLLAAIFVSVHTTLLHRQWHSLGSFSRDLWESGSIRPGALPGGSIDEFDAETDRLMHQPLWYVIPLVISGALVALVYDTLQRKGIYASLDPGTPDWQRDAFRNWWANGDEGMSAKYLECLFLFWTFYYILRHNVIGVVAQLRLRVLFPMRAVRSTFDFGAPGADLETARRTMALMIRQVATSTILLAFPFFMLLLACPDGVQDFVAFFALIFIVLSPSYIIMPTMRFNRHVALAYDEVHAQLAVREQEARQTKRSNDLILVTLDRLRLADAPRTLLSTVQVLAFSVIYLIPVATFFDWGLQRLL
jgi:hypothetical protein